MPAVLLVTFDVTEYLTVLREEKVILAHCLRGFLAHPSSEGLEE